jgi:hypothetical protein
MYWGTIFLFPAGTFPALRLFNSGVSLLDSGCCTPLAAAEQLFVIPLQQDY